MAFANSHGSLANAIAAHNVLPSAFMRLPTFSLKSLPWGRCALALATLPGLSGCEWMHMNGRQSVMVPEGPVAASQLSLFYVTCWVTLVIFIIVGSVLAYTTFKFKARTEADENAVPPEQGHGNPFIEVGLIGGSVLALAWWRCARVL